jgi:7-cyano-7-deazaguanine synthase
MEIDLAAFGGSALTDPGISIPKDRSDLESTAAIPTTYVPARNTIFLSYALAWAEVLGAFDIFIGVNSTDYSGYPDCRAEFIAAFETMANLATAAAVEGRGRFRIHTPIIELSKAEIIRTGTQLGVDYSLTHSCYDPIHQAEAAAVRLCRLRLRGFAEAGDPLNYVEQNRCGGWVHCI